MDNYRIIGDPYLQDYLVIDILHEYFSNSVYSFENLKKYQIGHLQLEDLYNRIKKYEERIMQDDGKLREITVFDSDYKIVRFTGYEGYINELKEAGKNFGKILEDWETANISFTGERRIFSKIFIGKTNMEKVFSCCSALYLIISYHRDIIKNLIEKVYSDLPFDKTEERDKLKTGKDIKSDSKKRKAPETLRKLSNYFTVRDKEEWKLYNPSTKAKILSDIVGEDIPVANIERALNRAKTKGNYRNNSEDDDLIISLLNGD